MDLLNKGLHTTDRKLYFISYDTKERLEIQFVPAELAIRRDVGVSPIKIIGRNTPHYHQGGNKNKGSGETKLTLSLDFYADESASTSVKRKVDWLNMLTHTDGDRKGAQRVILVFGDMFKNEVWTITDLDAVFNNFDKPNGFMPRQATVHLTMALDMNYNLTWDDLRPTYREGQPDGSNPIDLGIAANTKSDEPDYGLIAADSNAFENILRRAASRLRLI